MREVQHHGDGRDVDQPVKALPAPAAESSQHRVGGGRRERREKAECGEAGGAASQLGGLASLLDQDGDGSVADDIMGGIAKGLGGKLFGGR